MLRILLVSLIVSSGMIAFAENDTLNYQSVTTIVYFDSLEEYQHIDTGIIIIKKRSIVFSQNSFLPEIKFRISSVKADKENNRIMYFGTSNYIECAVAVSDDKRTVTILGTGERFIYVIQ